MPALVSVRNGGKCPIDGRTQTRFMNAWLFLEGKGYVAYLTTPIRVCERLVETITDGRKCLGGSDEKSRVCAINVDLLHRHCAALFCFPEDVPNLVDREKFLK